MNELKLWLTDEQWQAFARLSLELDKPREIAATDILIQVMENEGLLNSTVNKLP